MKHKTLPQTLYVWIAALGLCSAAEAHQVWLEQPEGENAILRFGEFGENLRETSPGLLDNFGSPAAKLLAKDQKAKPLALTKTATGFSAPVRLAPGESLIAEDTRFPIRAAAREGRPGDEARRQEGREGRPGDGARRQGGQETRNRSWPAARLITDFAAQTPTLTLDIVPAGKPGVFKVTFKGKPLPKAAVGIFVQSGWNKRARTDDDGQVAFDLPWKGQYVMSVSHSDRTPGARDGEKYDGINYTTTLTLTQPAGLAPFPAPPAAKPNPGK
jgi:hypothetical protein